MEEFKIKARFLSSHVLVGVGDITVQRVDAIVNAANSTLLGGGGVDGAIHARGGPSILDECRELRRARFPDGMPAGHAVITGAGRLSAKNVIHTVGPIRALGHAPDALALAACYRNCLLLAVESGLRSIAFPAIATGAFAYPREEAAAVASETIESVLNVDSSLTEVRLVFYEIQDATVFLKNHRFTAAHT